MVSSMSASLARLNTPADVSSEALLATLAPLLAWISMARDPFAPFITGPSPDPFVWLAPLPPFQACPGTTACGITPLADAGGTALAAGVVGTMATGASA